MIVWLHKQLVGRARACSRKSPRAGNPRHVVRGELPARWEWQDDDGVSWVPYSESVSLVLERAQDCGDSCVFLGGRQGWEVDLRTMHQTNTAFSGRNRSIRRVDLAAGAGALGPPPAVCIALPSSSFASPTRTLGTAPTCSNLMPTCRATGLRQPAVAAAAAHRLLATGSGSTTMARGVNSTHLWTPYSSRPLCRDTLRQISPAGTDGA
jgi:hypothetical protein